MKAQKKFWMPLITMLVLLMANGVLSLTIEASSPVENNVLCQTFGGTIDINVSDVNDETGAADGNLYAVYVTNQADGNFGIAIADPAGGLGNLIPDFNAVYADGDGNMTLNLTIPPIGVNATNFGTGNLTITVIDLNGGSSTATITLNIKPTWTQTEFTTSPLICNIPDYAATGNFTLIDSSSNSVKFTVPVDISGDLDFDTSVNLTDTSAEVVAGTLTNLANKKATITWPNLSSAGIIADTSANVIVRFNTGEVLAADQICTDKCETIEVANGTATVKVTGFSKYTISNDGANANPRVPGVGSALAVIGSGVTELPVVGAVSNMFIVFLIVVIGIFTVAKVKGII